MEKYNKLTNWAKKKLASVKNNSYEDVINDKVPNFSYDRFIKKLHAKYQKLYRTDCPDYMIERLLVYNTKSNNIWSSGDDSCGGVF